MHSSRLAFERALGSGLLALVMTLSDQFDVGTAWFFTAGMFIGWLVIGPMNRATEWWR